MSPGKKPRIKKVPPPPTPKATKPWDIPPFPKKGDENAGVLYEAIGHALSEWNKFEETLATIFASLVTGQQTEAAERAYGSVVSFSGRIEMIKAALEGFLFHVPESAEHLKKPLTDMLREALQFSGRRNEIAHGVVQENRPPFRSTNLEVHLRSWLKYNVVDSRRPVGFVLSPANSTTKKTQLEKTSTLTHSAATAVLFPVTIVPHYGYTSIEVNMFAENFAILQKYANRFPLAIVAWRQKAKAQTSL
jgi:hypothetical protein